jgi:hypothetical protein
MRTSKELADAGELAGAECDVRDKLRAFFGPPARKPAFRFAGEPTLARSANAEGCLVVGEAMPDHLRYGQALAIATIEHAEDQRDIGLS